MSSYIISSSLGMDATTVYTDVNINRAQLAAPDRTAAATGGFELALADLKMSVMRALFSTERSGVHAISAVAGNTNRHDAQWSQEQVVGSMVSEILGQKAEVREL